MSEEKDVDDVFAAVKGRDASGPSTTTSKVAARMSSDS